MTTLSSMTLSSCRPGWLKDSSNIFKYGVLEYYSGKPLEWQPLFFSARPGGRVAKFLWLSARTAKEDELSQAVGSKETPWPHQIEIEVGTVIPFDRGGRVPVIRSSICTGERTVGFKDPVSGRFQEYMLIQNDGDFQEFLRRYQVTETELKREW